LITPCIRSDLVDRGSICDGTRDGAPCHSAMRRVCTH
jgi:hypothetical protein